MSSLFNDQWMKQYQVEWNKESALIEPLKAIGFCSNIGYGFPNEAQPRGYIVIKNGQIVDAGSYQGEELSWDLRAKDQHWKEWFKREVGTTGFGLAYSTGKLKFIRGDYKAMIKNPGLAKPFIKSFSAMGRVHECLTPSPDYNKHCA